MKETIYFLDTHSTAERGAGIGSYKKRQKEILSDTYRIVDIVISNENRTSTSDVIFLGEKEAEKYLRKIIAEKAVIINHGSFLYKYLLSYDGHIFVQHGDWNEYWASSLGWRIKLYWKKMTGKKIFLGNPLAKSKNTFFFSEYHNKKKKNGVFFSKTPIDNNFKRVNNKKRDKILYVGRLDQDQKNIKGFLKLKNFKKISFIGSGHYKKLFINKNNYIGQVQNKEISKYLSQSRALILLSNYEGSPMVISEALYAGVPVITWDSFDWAKNELKNLDFCFVSKYKDYKDVDENINKLMNMNDDEWTKLSLQAQKWAIDEYDISKFKKSWIKCIEKVKKGL